jgi:hypothetical protein
MEINIESYDQIGDYLRPYVIFAVLKLSIFESQGVKNQL